MNYVRRLNVAYPMVGITIPGSRIPAHFSNPEIPGLPWLNPGISGLKKFRCPVDVRGPDRG